MSANNNPTHLKTFLDKITALKREGNDCFSTGNLHFGDEQGKESFRNACVLYGQAIEAIMEWEALSLDEPHDNSIHKEKKAQERPTDDQTLLPPNELEQLSSHKITLFLNLAQSNINLGGFDGALRCCNAALQLCNTPTLSLAELAPSDEDVDVVEPVVPTMYALVTKALFRRGKCYSELGDLSRAMNDFQTADRMSPNTKTILDSLSDTEMQMRSDSTSVSAWGTDGHDHIPATATTIACTMTSVSSVLDHADNVTIDRSESESCVSIASSSCANVVVPGNTMGPTKSMTIGELPTVQQEMIGSRDTLRTKKNSAFASHTVPLFPSELTVNGGQCWLRKGYWSQTTIDATVFLPVSLFRGNGGRGTVSPSTSAVLTSSRQQWTVEFKRMTVQITYSPTTPLSSDTPTSNDLPRTALGSKSLTLRLEHIIVSSECTWTVETIEDQSNQSDDILFSTSVTASPSSLSSSSRGMEYMVLHLLKAPSVEWFPGCEWWDRVFAGDEAIDTMTCSVGTDVAQLPQEAQNAAERENRRFVDLTEQQRQAEISTLIQAKQAFLDAELQTRTAAQIEHDAIEEVPERAEMLEALRKEFPSIVFSTK